MMKMNFKLWVIAFLGWTLGLQPVQAQQIIKRVKCADLAGTTIAEEHMIYENKSNQATRLTVQVVRDGCRPKLTDGTMSLLIRTQNSVGFRYFTRNGRSTQMLDILVPDQAAVKLRFSGSGQNVRGSLDYSIDAE
jgi:hypothetical protein